MTRRIQALLILLGTLACVAKDAGTQQQALDTKQQMNLKKYRNALHVKQQQQQAIDLNVNQMIQSIGQNHRFAVQQIARIAHSGYKECCRDHIVAGLLTIFLLAFGAHRW